MNLLISPRMGGYLRYVSRGPTHVRGGPEQAVVEFNFQDGGNHRGRDYALRLDWDDLIEAAAHLAKEGDTRARTALGVMKDPNEVERLQEEITQLRAEQRRWRKEIFRKNIQLSRIRQIVVEKNPSGLQAASNDAATTDASLVEAPV